MIKNPIDLFDVVGPVMIGPSSSHTAGAAKIGYTAYELLQEEPTRIRIKLYNSFTDTGKGHKTDLALLGGCLGMQPDDENLALAAGIARNKKIDFKIKWNYHSEDLHPNTAIIDLRGKKNKVSLVGYSIGGGRIKIHKQKLEIKQPAEKSSATQSNSAKKIKAGNNYYTFQQIKNSANTGKQFLKLALETQADHFQQTPEEILQEFARRWAIMVQSIDKGTSSRKRSEDQMFGGDSYRIRRSKLNVLSRVIENGIFYSVGVAEHNAKMGKIVAAPTAGACGIMPGILRAMQEKFQFSDQNMAEALAIAAAVGATIANKVALAGAVAGCQAEIGAAGTMTAAAGVYLLGGKVSQMEAAASLVLANVLGLTCDPVMGRVEVPCILRNGMIASMSFAAIELGLDNVKYSIPFDEVINVMGKVGKDMRDIYKETSKGGLAQTQTARTLCRSCGACG